MKSVIKSYCEILKLAWPIALGMLNNAIMQFTDRAFLANESLLSLEAVLPASMLAFIFLSFFQSVVAYSGIFVAQYQGANDLRNVRLSYRAGLILAFIFGLIMLPLVPFGNFILSLANHSAEVLSREVIYYSIVASGGIALFGQMAAQSYFTGRGKTRIIFIVNIIGNLLNIVLDPFLIFGWSFFPQLGIAGAAIATVFSTFVQWMILAFLAANHEKKTVSWHNTKEEIIFLIKRILKFGIPSGGHAVLDCLSFTIFVFITGTVGDIAFAVSNACFSVSYLLFAPIQGFALAASTLVGQAQGRGDYKAAYLIGNRATILAILFISFLILLLLVFYRPILMLFASDPASINEFLNLGFTLFVMLGIWEIFDAADVVLAGGLKGAGDTRFVFVWMLIVAFGMWIPIVLLVSHFYNTIPALWATVILEVVVMFIGTSIRWMRRRWRKIKLL